MSLEQEIAKLNPSTAVRQLPSGKWAFNNPTGGSSHAYKTKSEAESARKRWNPGQSQFMELGLLNVNDILTYSPPRSRTKDPAYLTIIGVAGKCIMVKHQGKAKSLREAQASMGGSTKDVNYKAFKLDKFNGITLAMLRDEVNRHSSRKPISRPQPQMNLNLQQPRVEQVEDKVELPLTDSISTAASFNELITNFASSASAFLSEGISHQERANCVGKALVELTSNKMIDS